MNIIQAEGEEESVESYFSYIIIVECKLDVTKISLDDCQNRER